MDLQDGQDKLRETTIFNARGASLNGTGGELTWICMIGRIDKINCQEQYGAINMDMQDRQD